MKKFAYWLVCVVAAVIVPSLAAQQQDSTTCTFADGKAVRITYSPAPAEKPLNVGKAWSPGGRHMLIFTDAPTAIAGTEIPIGAYSIYLVPGQKEWTLVLSRDVDSGASYKKSDDLLRAPMQVGILPSKENRFQAYMGAVAPNQCSVRFDYGQTRAWIELIEK